MKTLHEVALNNLLDQGLKVGSKVKVIAKAESYSGGWKAGWHYKMDQFIGNELEVTGFKGSNYGITLRSPGDDYWHFPAFCLELVKYEEKTKKTPEIKKELEEIAKKLNNLLENI